MRLPDSRYEYIKEEVIDTFFRYDVKCIPISGFELAQKMGIVLLPYSIYNRETLERIKTVSEDGFYFEPGDGKEYICYNDEIGYKRCNMTLLHEIAHCILGHNSFDSIEAESEAGFFAKYAAAPPPLVHKILPTSPYEIAEYFDLSVEASYNAYCYYQKWLNKYKQYGGYTQYEQNLLTLFSVS